MINFKFFHLFNKNFLEPLIAYTREPPHYLWICAIVYILGKALT